MDRLTPEKAGKTRISLDLLGAAAFMVVADARVIDPLLHVIADNFQTTVGSAAVIISAYTIPYGLFQLVYGPLGDRIGKLKVMTVAMGAFAIGTAMCAVVTNMALFTLLRLLTGMVAAAIIPLSLAYIGDNFPYAERQAALGRYLGVVVLGQILSGSLGGIFGEYVSWRGIFVLFGIVSLVIALMMGRAIRLVPDRRRPQSSTGLASFQPYYQLITQPAPRTIIITVFIEGFCLWGGFAYIGAFLRDQYHLSYVIIGFVLSSFGLGGLIYSRSVKWLVRRLGERGLIAVGGWLMCASYVLLAVFQVWILFIPLNILMGLGFYMMHGTLQTLATELTPETRGTAVALFAFSLFIGQGLGAAVFGKIVDTLGYIVCFIVAGVAIALLSIWFLIQKKR